VSIAVVAIGRNEGDRLKRCLTSATQQAQTVVYVDSGSTDGSVAFAQSLGVRVVNLDMTRPFTAARARNEGFECVREIAPDTRFVQFVDGDCEIAPGWLSQASAFLEAQSQVAAVCGRRRERHPQASVFNALCDLEWDTPVGQTKACGGDVLMRAAALAQVRGYNPSVIAGEEPELCIRLRAAGWTIWRLQAEMTLHDANILILKQWWTRAKRCGYAYALGKAMHGAPPERHWVKETRRALGWVVGLPVLAAMACAAVGPWGLTLLAIYPAQVLRLARRSRLQPTRAALWDGALQVLGKFAEARGIGSFWLDRWQGRTAKIIEYK
jgi:glycosyltransferase involved in cell wall biosynthesis